MNLFTFLISSAACWLLWLDLPSSNALPNVVVILTDDQDVTLHSLNYMTNLNNLLVKQGQTYTNAFAATPICCPSRSSIHTGRYIHNTQVYDNSIQGNCASFHWQENAELYNVAWYLQEKGYQTGFYGKYLNNYGFPEVGGVSHVPRGWNDWVGLVGNSVYYDYELSVNGVSEKHGSNYEKDYLPNILRNHSLSFIESKVKESSPFLAFLSLPSCHQPAVPAPQYTHLFPNIQAPRTPAWNLKATNKHWFVNDSAVFGPMNTTQTSFSDFLYRRRLETLQTVDDIVGDVYRLLERLGALEETYIIYTSDNGYHLGLFGLALDKRLPYEDDIRLPFIVRGPQVVPGSTNEAVVANIDIAPTLLDLAGVGIPDTMDGKSLLSTFKQGETEAFTREVLLIEYHGIANECSGLCHVVAGKGVACFVQEEFKQPPYWGGESFCNCQDSKNQTYWCLRIINEGSNWKYCEFVDGFVEFYDLLKDPYELDNSWASLSGPVLDSLKKQLNYLKTCKGQTGENSCTAL